MLRNVIAVLGKYLVTTKLNCDVMLWSVHLYALNKYQIFYDH